MLDLTSAQPAFIVDLGRVSPSRGIDMSAWSYKVVTITLSDRTHGALDDAGSDGWAYAATLRDEDDQVTLLMTKERPPAATPSPVVSRRTIDGRPRKSGMA
jgi:hypothetical protein